MRRVYVQAEISYTKRNRLLEVTKQKYLKDALRIAIDYTIKNYGKKNERI